MSWDSVLNSLGITTLVMIVINFIALILEKRQQREINWEEYFKLNAMILTFTAISLILSHYGFKGNGGYYYSDY